MPVAGRGLEYLVCVCFFKHLCFWRFFSFTKFFGVSCFKQIACFSFFWRVFVSDFSVLLSLFPRGILKRYCFELFFFSVFFFFFFWGHIFV